MNGRERFTVSHEGMREQNAGRPPWELVKELIQNCWDEAPEATECWVSIKSTKTGTTITVEDDGPGFAGHHRLLHPSEEHAKATGSPEERTV